MPRQQPFNEYLNSAGPSTPRGRGRGGRGGRGGGGPIQGSSHTFAADYSQVPFDYSKLTGRRYNNSDGFAVQPFGNTPQSAPESPYSTPRGRGTPFRARGRGGSAPFPRTPQSGSATPVTGLGYHGQGHTFPDKGKGKAREDCRSLRGRGLGAGRHRLGDTVGRQGVFWGGGNAPLFVKAGELFKDGEVDIISIDKENHIHIDVEPLSDPSAPQMYHLDDDVEIDIVDDQLADVLAGRSREPTPWTPDTSHNDDTRDETSFESAAYEDGDQLDVHQQETNESAATRVQQLTSDLEEQLVVSATAEEFSTSDTNADIGTAATSTFINDIAKPAGTTEGDFFVDVQPAIVEERAQSEESEDPFFVDTEPVPGFSLEVPQYQTSSAVPLGYSPEPDPVSEDENIIFKPKTFAKPQPISIGPEVEANHVEAGPSSMVSSAFVNPHAISRREKKALKKEKRIRNKNKKGKKGRRQIEPHGGSDLDWGSDGPPTHILRVEGVDEETDGDHDMKILKDYLAGTLLGAESEGESYSSDVDEAVIEVLGDGAAEVGEGEDFEIESGEEDNPWVDTSGSGSDAIDVEIVDSDSSDLGELQIEAKGLDSEEEDEDEEDGVDMFKGKDNWGDTEWLIAQMEEALDGDVNMADRKARNATFRAIENGDFGDDWGTVPYKKNKNGSHLPAELQGQWEKDRQRKAERKRQRDLERLLDAIDPHPATHGKKGKGKKAKGTSRIEQARMAHLIPESASRVAELFDIPTDDDEEGAPFGKMGRMANLLPGGRGLVAIDEGIKRFLEDEGKTTYSVPPMDKEGRKKVHMLAECYGLSSKSRGKGTARFTVLTKTRLSGLNVKEDKAARLVAAAGFSGGKFYKALYTKKSKGEGKSKKGPGDRGASARMREGETVGEGAERIGQENVGHRLLSRMGWAEGGKIGKSEGGLENPILAIVKNTKMGLGA